MDEPLSNLDAKLRVETRANIARLHQRLKTTTVYVTHDQVEAMTMGHRIAVMSEARLQQVGTPQELYDEPHQQVRGRLHRLAVHELPARSTSRRGTGDDVDAHGLPALPIALPRADFKGQAGGASAVLGIRPGAPRPRSRPDASAHRSRPQADVVEYLGNEELIHAVVESHEIVALVPSERRVQEGQTIDLTVPAEKLHVFDPESEKALMN